MSSMFILAAFGGFMFTIVFAFLWLIAWTEHKHKQIMKNLQDEQERLGFRLDGWE